jgi:hypothetical protein
VDELFHGDAVSSNSPADPNAGLNIKKWRCLKIGYTVQVATPGREMTINRWIEWGFFFFRQTHMGHQQKKYYSI